MAATWTQGWSGVGGRGKAIAWLVGTLVAAGMIVALVRGGQLGNASGDDADSVGGGDSSTAEYSTQEGKTYATGDESRSGPVAGRTAPAVGANTADSAPSPMPPSVGAGNGTAIVRSAEMSVRLKDLRVATAVGRLGGLAERLGGYVASTTTAEAETGAGKGSADLVLRVPSERLDAARAEVSKLGEVQSVRLSGDDVSGQLVDLDARLRTLRTEEMALNELLGRSRDVPAILQVRDRLTGIRSEIEQLAGQQTRVRDQVRMASLTVSLLEKDASAGAVPGEEDKGLGNDLRAAGNAFVAVIGGTIIVAAALAPIAALALLALLVARRFGRRDVAAG